MRIETLAVHAGRHVDPSTGAVAVPVHLATTFERDPDGGYSRGHLYARNSNPTRETLEACLRDLEGGVAAAAFGSGTAATAAVFQSLVPGDHVVAPMDAYHGTLRQLREVFAPRGVEVSFVEMTDPSMVETALRPSTRLVWIETPSNPLWKVTDIARVAEIAHGVGATCLCDSTAASPVLQRPLALGADLVMHATTKYLGGHSDVMGGAIVAAAEGGVFARVRALQAALGAVPSPFDCWLVLRGIQTLPWRVRAQSENAARVAAFLAGHPRVAAVHYPGLASHPGHALAARQMSAFGGMLSFQVRGGRDDAMAVAAKVRLFTRATSFGGTESLIEHRASVEGPETRTPQGLLRLSVGLEHADDLIEDLAQALG
ncbi:MAG: aminotransferase class V-fold PLP-dependent enzyme [Candidatus Rokubacteria bacterium]|nr:aminotransferase class V-fold PLP-dependent enzyme [Candidatus Rokubacteria bacterium]